MMESDHLSRFEDLINNRGHAEASSHAHLRTRAANEVMRCLDLNTYRNPAWPDKERTMSALASDATGPRDGMAGVFLSSSTEFYKGQTHEAGEYDVYPVTKARAAHDVAQLERGV
jgi:hypothetical protein